MNYKPPILAPPNQRLRMTPIDKDPQPNQQSEEMDAAVRERRVKAGGKYLDRLYRELGLL